MIIDSKLRDVFSYQVAIRRPSQSKSAPANPAAPLTKPYAQSAGGRFRRMGGGPRSVAHAWKARVIPDVTPASLAKGMGSEDRGPWALVHGVRRLDRGSRYLRREPWQLDPNSSRRHAPDSNKNDRGKICRSINQGVWVGRRGRFSGDGGGDRSVGKVLEGSSNPQRASESNKLYEA